jgi:hypothetical protein
MAAATLSLRATKVFLHSSQSASYSGGIEGDQVLHSGQYVRGKAGRKAALSGCNPYPPEAVYTESRLSVMWQFCVTYRSKQVK